MKYSRKAGAALCFAVLSSYSAAASVNPVSWALDNSLLDGWDVAQGNFGLEHLTRLGNLRFSPHEHRGASHLPTTLDSPGLYSREFMLPGEAVCGPLPGEFAGDSWCGQSLFKKRTRTKRSSGLGGNEVSESKSPALAAPEPDVVVLMGLGLIGIAFTRMTRRQRRRTAGLIPPRAHFPVP